jgi:putative endonuclease
LPGTIRLGLPWSVYIVRCGDGSLYTGATNDLAARVSAHNKGRGARYTRSRLPVALVFSEVKRTRGAALSREWQLKQLSRTEKLLLVQAAEGSSRRRQKSVTRAPGPRRTKRSGRARSIR